MNKVINRETLIDNIPRFVTDFWVFLTECLGMKEGNGYKDLTPEHFKLARFMQFDTNLSKLILMPRYSLKSTIATSGYALWEMIRNPDIRILIYSDSATKAQGFLQDIKNQIQGEAVNSSFRDYFLKWETDPHKGKWNESQITIRTRNFQHKEPTVDTGGIETTKVGYHYDMIIFDDIVSDLNVTTKAQMDKVYDCYKKSLSLLKPGGKVVIVGTRWSFGDAYGRIINDSKDTFGFFIRKAEIDGTYPFASIGLDQAFLEQKKKDQGTYFYSCLYNQNPVSDEDAIFKYEDFKFYGDIDYTKLHLVATCDPAGEGADYTAISVVGTDKDLNMYLLELVNKHLKPDQIVKEIIRLSYKYKFSKFGVENNFFKNILENEIKLAVSEEMKNPNFVPFSIESFTASAKVGEGKFARILSLQPFHERGALRFPGDKFENLKGSFSELADQMLQVSHNHMPIHDDLLDAVSYATRLIRRGSEVVSESKSYGSMDWLVDKIYKEELAENRTLPLRFRKSVRPLFT